MAALAADRNTQATKASQYPILIPVAAAKKIYGGAIVVADANGRANPGSTALNLIYLGRAASQVDNTLGAAGALSIQVDRGQAFYFDNSGGDPVDQTCLGKTIYIVDDHTVSKTNGANTQSAGGICVGVDANGVWML